MTRISRLSALLGLRPRCGSVRRSLFVLIPLATACGSRAPAVSRDANGAAPAAARFSISRPLVIAPFENLSRSPDAAEIVGLLIDDALRGAGVPIAGSLAGSLPRGRLATPLEIQAGAAAVGASFALSGTVLEYGFRDSANVGERPEPIVSVDLRLLDVTSGRVVWQQGFSATSGRMLRLKNDGLGSVSHSLAQEVAVALSMSEER